MQDLLVGNLQSPISKNEYGQLPKWPKGTDCKSVVRRLRRFESFTAHSPKQFGTARIAHIAQSVEHTLGKGEVTGPNPVVGSVAEKFCVYEKGERDMAKAKYDRSKPHLNVGTMGH